jgi:signal peptidase I
MQHLNWTILLLACLIAGCNTSAPSVPAVVEGDSMAPTVCGACLSATCDECGFDFKTEFIAKPDAGLTCPNCGYDELKAGDMKLVESPEVSLEPFKGFPRRWDIVGFNLPAESEKETGVKRIVGLPGETIEFKDGDLYSRNNILRKPWELQKEVRVPVFDSQCNAIAPFDNPSRFRHADEDSGWEVRGKELRFAAIGDSLDWLDYVHWRNCQRVGNRNDEFPIEDSYGFNQKLVREMNSTDDLMVELDVDFEVDSQMRFLFRRNRAEFCFTISRTETEISVSCQKEGQRKPLVLVSKLETDLPAATIEFSSFDRSIQLRINGTNVFELREDESSDVVSSESSFPPNSKSVFRIGGEEGVFRINRLQVWRDLYYLASPAGFEAPKNLKLTAGDDEYILLGDNSPKSLDSRTWGNPGIPRSDLIGKLNSTPPAE